MGNRFLLSSRRNVWQVDLVLAFLARVKCHIRISYYCYLAPSVTITVQAEAPWSVGRDVTEEIQILEYLESIPFQLRYSVMMLSQSSRDFFLLLCTVFFFSMISKYPSKEPALPISVCVCMYV